MRVATRNCEAAVQASVAPAVKHNGHSHDQTAVAVYRLLEVRALDRRRTLREWAPLWKQRSDVQRLVRMIFEYHQPDVDALRGVLFEQARMDYGAAMAAEARAAGYPIQGVRVLDERVLADLNRRANFASRSIATTYNRDLRREIKRIAAEVPKANRSVYCLAPTTRVLTADLRWVALGGVREGDQLTAFDELCGSHAQQRPSRRRWRLAAVEQIGRQVLPTYRIELADGTVVFASDGHLWLCKEDVHNLAWRSTSELFHHHERVGRPRIGRGGAWRAAQYIVKPLDVWETERSYHGGFLAAAFAGEGYLSQRAKFSWGLAYTSMGFVQKANSFLDMVCESLTLLGYHFTRHQRKADLVQVVINGGRAKVMRFLGHVRPPRLLEQFQPDKFGQIRLNRWSRIVDISYAGEQELVTIGTSTRTLLAEGLASHNSKRLDAWEKSRASWKAEQIAYTEMGETIHGAQMDFVRLNDLAVRARVVPETGQCAYCEEIAGEGWMDFATAEGLGLPAHPGCIHSLELDYDTASLPPLGDLLVGGQMLLGAAGELAGRPAGGVPEGLPEGLEEMG